jgi:periplasmic protein TonB
VTRHYLPALALGILVTLGLLWVMQVMVLNSQTGIKETSPLKMVEFVRLNREEPLKARKRTLPDKPPPRQKPPPPKMVSTPAKPVDAAMPSIDIPNVEIPVGSPRIEGSLLGGLEIGAREVDTSLVPIFMIRPEYPMRAAKRRIEGWVRVEFTVDKQGHVVDPVVVESNPGSVFDRAAIKALSRWRFKPKIVGGIAVEQRAVQLLNFKLDK